MGYVDGKEYGIWFVADCPAWETKDGRGGADKWSIEKAEDESEVCASPFYAMLAVLTLHIASLAVNVTVENRKYVSRIHHLFVVCLSKFQCDRQVPCSHV